MTKCPNCHKPETNGPHVPLRCWINTREPKKIGNPYAGEQHKERRRANSPST